MKCRGGRGESQCCPRASGRVSQSRKPGTTGSAGPGGRINPGALWQGKQTGHPPPESAEFHRSRQPSHAIWWFVSAGLRLQAGCRQRASGDRGGGHEQPAAAGTAAQRCRCQNPHGPQAQKQEGIKDLRPAQGDRGAGERPDQGRPRSATIPAAGPGEGRR